MGTEIEHKFLVATQGWREHVDGSQTLRQGYLCVDPARTVRVRLVDSAHGFLTIKGTRVGNRRAEFEYEIPAQDAAEMLDHQCLRPLIEKTRHHLSLSPGEWIVDEFTGDNDGLVMAEVELAEGQSLGDLPDWVGEDVTADDRYANANLQLHPYGSWTMR